MYLAFVSLLASTHIISSSSSQNCSAFHSFVEVQSASPSFALHNITLTSSQALFSPHSYYVALTQLSVLPIEDDICTDTTLSTDISNKIVLLFETIGACSIHYKVFSAQNNGALAVLMANNDDSGQVVNIIDDDNTITTSIPMRSISKSDGTLLSDAVNSNTNIFIKIGCFDSSYPSMLCLSDPLGEFYRQSGEYQLQEDITMNDHPVWRMHGYPLVRSDVYMFLHDASGTSDWYWAVTEDETFIDDMDIKAKCSAGGAQISDPSSCPLWMGTWSGITFFEVAQLNVTDGVCVIGGEQICIDSDIYILAGLSGTYTLHSAGAPEWFRDLTECDERAAALLYIDTVDDDDTSSYWQLLDPLQDIEIAKCSIDSSQQNNDTWKWRPDLCTEWLVRNDIGLRYSDAHFYVDDTLSVTVGSCLTNALCEASVAPDTLCMNNNSILNGALMGYYVKLNETGQYFDSPIYKRVVTGTTIDIFDNTLYVWYVNELYASLGFADFIDRRWWVLTSDALSDAYEQGAYQYYGYCPGYAYGNVVNCAGWIFEENSINHYDEEMTLTQGECAVDPTTKSIPETWPQYICMSLINETHDFASNNGLSQLQTSLFIGGYAMDTSNMTQQHPFPQWIKPYNELEQDDIYLFLSTNGRWMISSSSSSSSSSDIKMQCDAFYKTQSYNPVECNRWYDDEYELLDNIRIEECSLDDILTISPTSAPTAPTSAPSVITSTPTLHPTAVPTPTRTVCLSRNGTIQSFFEGIYHDANTGEDGTIELIKEGTNDGVYPDLYIWYHEAKWVIAPMDYASAYAMGIDTASVYGYCYGGMKTGSGYPFCDDDWQFYWSLSVLNSDSKYITDATFVMSADLSVCDDEYEYIDSDLIKDTDALCINDIYDGVPPYIEDIIHALGEYAIVEDATTDIVSMYFHIDPDNIDYIWYDKLSNHWSVQNELEYDVLLLCHNENGMPLGCVIWDDEESTSVNVDDIISIMEQCIGSDGGTDKGVDAGTVVGIVIVIIVCGIGIAFLVQLWLRYKKEKAEKPRASMDAIEAEICQTEAFATTLTPMSTNFDTKARSKTTEVTHGYDMSPLNTGNDNVDEHDADDPEVDDTDAADTDGDDPVDPLTTDAEVP